MGTVPPPADAIATATTTLISSTSARSGMNSVVDSAHSYYLRPSDYPRMNLVSSVFDGKSYGGWRRAVVIALSAKKKTRVY